MNEQQLAKILKLKQEKAAEKEARILDEKAKLQQYYSKAILNLLPEIKADAKMVYMCDQAGVKFPTYINEVGRQKGVKFFPEEHSGAFGLIRLALDHDHPYAYKNYLGWSYFDGKHMTRYGVVCLPTGELIRKDFDRVLRGNEEIAPEHYKEFYLKYLESHKEFHEFLDSLE